MNSNFSVIVFISGYCSVSYSCEIKRRINYAKLKTLYLLSHDLRSSMSCVANNIKYFRVCILLFIWLVQWWSRLPLRRMFTRVCKALQLENRSKQSSLRIPSLWGRWIEEQPVCIEWQIQKTADVKNQAWLCPCGKKCVSGGKNCLISLGAL